MKKYIIITYVKALRCSIIDARDEIVKTSGQRNDVDIRKTGSLTELLIMRSIAQPTSLMCKISLAGSGSLNYGKEGLVLVSVTQTKHNGDKEYILLFI